MRQRATTSTIHTFSPQRTYRYGYDSLSRLTRARYSDSEGGAGRYDTRYSYDLNGNLTSLVRRGTLSLSSAGTPSTYGAIDSLTLEYAGNRLRSVSDAAAGPHYQGAFHFVDGADEDEEYRYDFNGNTVTDLNRGILSSRFDTAGHPARMDFADGSSTCWLYDDAGTKLRTLHRVASVPVAVPGSQGPALTETVTDYSAGFVYEDSLLTRINLDGAYLSYTGADGSRLSTPEYHFYLRDHLGNNRVDVAADGRICQVTDYYPYGLPMASSRNAAFQRWLFGGKELDRISGLDLYDFEARAYDPALGRFRQPDPLAESYHPLSPYLYCAANPLANVDPSGKQIFLGTSPLMMNGGVDLMLSSSEPLIMTSRAGEVIRALPKQESHHIIPRALKGNKYVKMARKEGFKFEGKENRIDLPKYEKATGTGRHGSHPKYSGHIEKVLKEGPNADESPIDFILRIIANTKETIINNPDLKINDLFNALLNFIIPDTPAPPKQTVEPQKPPKSTDNPSNKQQQPKRKTIEIKDNQTE